MQVLNQCKSFFNENIKPKINAENCCKVLAAAAVTGVALSVISLVGLLIATGVGAPVGVVIGVSVVTFASIALGSILVFGFLGSHLYMNEQEIAKRKNFH